MERAWLEATAPLVRVPCKSQWVSPGSLSPSPLPLSPPAAPPWKSNCCLGSPQPGAGVTLRISGLRGSHRLSLPLPRGAVAAGVPMETTGHARPPPHRPALNLRFKTNIVINMQMYMRLP
jgi:hypothetical protein